MNLSFDGLLSGDGGFADIWRAFDATGRLVAVKIIRDSSIEISDALTHAKALVRAEHKNIVRVLAVTDVEDPGRAGTNVPAIVMEYLSGETLHDAMLTKRFFDVEFLKISIGLINAVRHIHQSGMVHGDLHEKNVMLVAGETKVIDLLYRYSLLSVKAEKHETLKAREVDAVCHLIEQLAAKSELDEVNLLAFIRDRKKSQSLDELSHSVWTLCGAPSIPVSPTALESPLPLVVSSISSTLKSYPEDRPGRPNKAETDVESRLNKVIPRQAHLTILNQGLEENITSHVATLTLVTDEPVTLSKSIEGIKSRLTRSLVADTTVIAPDISLSSLLQSPIARPELLDWLATTSFSAHLYFSERALLAGKSEWTDSKLRNEFVMLPIVHRLSDKSIRVEKMSSNFAEIEALLHEALAIIRIRYHRTVLLPVLTDHIRNPDRSLFDLAELILNCCLMYLATPNSDSVRAIFAQVRTRLKYAVNVPTHERHTRDRNPFP